MVDISNSWESDIASLLGTLSDVQRDLLDVLVRKAARARQRATCREINAIAVREAELIPRLQACQDRRQAVAMRERPTMDCQSDSIRSLRRRCRRRAAVACKPT